MLSKIKFFIFGTLFGMVLVGGVSFADEVYYSLVKVNYPIIVDNKEVSFEKPLLNYNGSTYLALTDVAKATGGVAIWNNEKKNIVLIKGDIVPKATIESMKYSAFISNYYKKLEDIYNLNENLVSQIILLERDVKRIAKDSVASDIKNIDILTKEIDSMLSNINTANITLSYTNTYNNLDNNDIDRIKINLLSQYAYLYESYKSLKLYNSLKNEDDFREYWINMDKAEGAKKDLKLFGNYDYLIKLVINGNKGF